MKAHTLIILSLMLLGLGFWAHRQALFKGIESAFAVGFFSPIRAGYPSFVTAEQEAEIQRREQRLQLRLKAEAITWRVLSVSLFAGSVLPLAIIGRRALQKRRKANCTQPQTE